MFINTRGTYGVSSAAYWWGRLAAGVQRLLLYTLGKELPAWALVYADDWDVTAQGPRFTEILVGTVLLFRALGLPISWKKVRGGLCYTWLGLERNLREWRLGLSERRAAWLIG